MSSLNPIHLGIALMRTVETNQLHGYGRHPDPQRGLDFDWQLLSFPRLPEQMLIRACGGLRHLFVTRKLYGAWLLYIDNLQPERWHMLFPQQTGGEAGDLLIDVKAIALPPTARIGGTILSVPPMKFAQPDAPLLSTDGLSILIDLNREWCVSKTSIIVGGEATLVLLNDFIVPMSNDRLLLERNSQSGSI